MQYKPHDDFEWDEAKNIQNKKKHNLSFQVASLIFDKPFFNAQSAYAGVEERWIAVGMLDGNRVVTVVYTLREDRIRIISARKARDNEKEKLLTFLDGFNDAGRA